MGDSCQTCLGTEVLNEDRSGCCEVEEFVTGQVCPDNINTPERVYDAECTLRLECKLQCSGAPNCGELHRAECSPVLGDPVDTCGECLPGYSHRPGPSNALCCPGGLSATPKFYLTVGPTTKGGRRDVHVHIQRKVNQKPSACVCHNLLLGRPLSHLIEFHPGHLK